MRIAIDAFGGDNAPLEVIKGSRKAADELGVDIILVGDEEKIKSVSAENSISLENIEINIIEFLILLFIKSASLCSRLKSVTYV